MKKVILLLNAIFLLCVCSACQKQMTDEEIVPKASEIQSENPTATIEATKVSTPTLSSTPTSTPTIKPVMTAEKNLGVTVDDFIENYYYLREISEPMQHLTDKLPEPEEAVNSKGYPTKSYYLYNENERSKLLLLTFVYSGDEESLTHINLYIQLDKQNEELLKLFNDYSIAFITTYIMSKNSPMNFNDEIITMANKFIQDKGDNDDVTLDLTSFSSLSKVTLIKVSD